MSPSATLPADTRGSSPPAAGRWGLLALLLAAPWAAGAVEAWAWGAMTMVAVLLLALWAAEQARRRRLELVWSPLYLPALALLALALAQWQGGLSLDSVSTREAVLKLGGYLLVFFLTQQFFAAAGGHAWRRIALAATVYAFALALFAIIQFFASPGLLYGVVRPRWGGYIFGPYVSHNNYAGLMEMLIPLAAALGLSLRPRHPAKPAVIFAVLLSVLSLLLSGSRGGFLALVAEFALLALLIFRARPRAGKNRLLLAGLALLVIVGAAFAGLDRGGVWKRWEELGGRLSASDRGRITADTLRMAGDHLPWGAGLGAFAAVYPAYQTVATDKEIDYAHNDYAQFLAEGGLAACLLTLLSLPAFLWLAFAGLRRRLQRRAGWLPLGAALGVCGLLVHSLADFNLHIPANAAWFAFCAGLAVLDPNSFREAIQAATSAERGSAPSARGTGQNPGCALAR